MVGACYVLPLGCSMVAMATASVCADATGGMTVRDGQQCKRARALDSTDVEGRMALCNVFVPSARVWLRDGSGRASVVEPSLRNERPERNPGTPCTPHHP